MNSRTIPQSQRRGDARPRPESRATFYRRRAVAAAVAGAAVLGSLHIYDAIRGDNRFDHKYKEVSAEFAKGQFAPGEAKRLNIDKNQSAWDDALEFTGPGASESDIDQVYNAIANQQGDTPQLGQPVILPTQDLLAKYQNK
jgi:hypothetical protein